MIIRKLPWAYCNFVILPYTRRRYIEFRVLYGPPKGTTFLKIGSLGTRVSIPSRGGKLVAAILRPTRPPHAEYYSLGQFNSLVPVRNDGYAKCVIFEQRILATLPVNSASGKWQIFSLMKSQLSPGNVLVPSGSKQYPNRYWLSFNWRQLELWWTYVYLMCEGRMAGKCVTENCKIYPKWMPP